MNYALRFHSEYHGDIPRGTNNNNSHREYVRTYAYYRAVLSSQTVFRQLTTNDFNTNLQADYIGGFHHLFKMIHWTITRNFASRTRMRRGQTKMTLTGWINDIGTLCIWKSTQLVLTMCSRDMRSPNGANPFKTPVMGVF